MDCADLGFFLTWILTLILFSLSFRLCSRPRVIGTFHFASAFVMELKHLFMPRESDKSDSGNLSFGPFLEIPSL
jgi:hypothetical protein